ncbi:MAG: hypothetical protein ACYDH5_01030 [Acidimicrobiales bacterium]
MRHAKASSDRWLAVRLALVFVVTAVLAGVLAFQAYYSPSHLADMLVWGIAGLIYVGFCSRFFRSWALRVLAGFVLYGTSTAVFTTILFVHRVPIGMGLSVASYPVGSLATGVTGSVIGGLALAVIVTLLSVAPTRHTRSTWRRLVGVVRRRAGNNRRQVPTDHLAGRAG